MWLCQLSDGIPPLTGIEPHQYELRVGEDWEGDGGLLNAFHIDNLIKWIFCEYNLYIIMKFKGTQEENFIMKLEVTSHIFSECW